jgi:hypothetical protein
MVSPFAYNFPEGTYIESYTFRQALVLDLRFFVVSLIMWPDQEATLTDHNPLINPWKMMVPRA